MVKAVLSAIPAWVWFLLAGVFLALSLLLWGNHKYSSGLTAGVRQGLEQKQAEIDRATAKKNDENRQRENALNASIDKLRADGVAERERLAAGVRDANRSADAFRLQLERLRKILADGAGGADPSIDTRSLSPRDAGILLTQLLDKSVKRNTELAAYAEAVSHAGDQCRRQYKVIYDDNQRAITGLR